MSNTAEEMRIQKFLSKAGVCSRRAAEGLMARGKVKVNGKVCRELGSKVIPGKDRVEVDDRQVILPDSFIYLLINKPANVITSLEDPEGRTVIADLLPKSMPRVWPVGRLDWDTEGLLLLTNDGNLTHLLTHPSHNISKEYAVKVQGIVAKDSPKLDQLREGVDIGDGEITRPAHVKLTGTTGRNTWLEIVIGEGRNRQVRRMFEAVEHPVMKLRRLKIGPLSIEGLASGMFRSLHSDEVRALYNELDVAVPELAQPTRRQQKREAKERERYAQRSKSSNKKGGAKKTFKTSRARAGARSSKPSSKTSNRSSRAGRNNRK